MPVKKEIELYIHIPFCVRKCKYCDFLSAPAGEDTIRIYMEALCREIREKSKQYQDYEVSTIFIGGGTPTAVEASWIAKLMENIREYYHVKADAEISMEMNPGTVKDTVLQIYKSAGINRLSIGLQSTEDDELQRLGRIHNYQQFLETYQQVRDAGFQNINVDIMSALPGQTLESYKRSLKRVAELVPLPEHISAYSLIIEEGTPFFDAFEAGTLELPEEETEREMYAFTEQFLKEYGYERYEISNYAQRGKECRHNLGYWQRKNYLGFGIGAASLVENVRFQNGSDLEEYCRKPEESVVEYQTLSVQEQIEETMFLGLRKTEGVSAERFEQIFGVTLEKVYGSVIEKHIQAGLLEWKAVNGMPEKYLALTTRGLDVSNYCLADFLEPSLFSEQNAL